jgi:uncharacterized protein (TIRG00374 family)
VILIGLVLAAAKYLNGAEVLAALRSFTYQYAPFMLLFSAGYLVIKSFRFVVLARPISRVPAAVPTLTLVKAYLAGASAILIPGGVAVRAGLMGQAGLPVEKSSAPVAYSSILDQAVLISGALLAALWFEGARLPALILLGILSVVGLVLLIPFTRGWVLRLAERIAGKFGFAEKWRTFLQAMKEVSNLRTLLIAFGMTAAALPLQIVVLDLSLRGVGQTASYPALFLAYLLPAILGRNSALPGGVGLTEAGMVGFLASAARLDPDTAAAAVAVFRIATVLFQSLLGALVYFFWWRGEGEKQPSPSEGEKRPSPSEGEKQPSPSEGEKQPSPSEGEKQPSPSEGERVEESRSPAD